MCFLLHRCFFALLILVFFHSTRCYARQKKFDALLLQNNLLDIHTHTRRTAVCMKLCTTNLCHETCSNHSPHSHRSIHSDTHMWLRKSSKFSAIDLSVCQSTSNSFHSTWIQRYIFLFINIIIELFRRQSVPTTSTQWMNWIFTISSVLLKFCFLRTYVRSNYVILRVQCVCAWIAHEKFHWIISVHYFYCFRHFTHSFVCLFLSAQINSNAIKISFWINYVYIALFPFSVWLKRASRIASCGVLMKCSSKIQT